MVDKDQPQEIIKNEDQELDKVRKELEYRIKERNQIGIEMGAMTDSMQKEIK